MYVMDVRVESDNGRSFVSRIGYGMAIYRTLFGHPLRQYVLFQFI
jgi:hypothetical protein